MTKVLCNNLLCKHFKHGECDKETISIEKEKVELDSWRGETEYAICLDEEITVG